MDLSKISLSGSGTIALASQTPKNRFEQLTFSRQLEHKAIWNSIGQYTPSCLNTAMKVVTFLPLVLVEAVARVLQAIGNVGVFALNTISNALCGRIVEVVDASKLEEPPFELVYSKPLISTEEKTSEPLPTKETVVTFVPATEEPTTIATDDGFSAVNASAQETDAAPVVENEQKSDEADAWENVNYPEPAAPATTSSYKKHFVTVVGAVIALATLGYFAHASGVFGNNDPVPPQNPPESLT